MEQHVLQIFRAEITDSTPAIINGAPDRQSVGFPEAMQVNLDIKQLQSLCTGTSDLPKIVYDTRLSEESVTVGMMLKMLSLRLEK